ncbi:MAG TPA: DUF4157 domain-containing protein [Pyrinomonadaceae bacterium]|nr:DUF4157 domain-containing protein [Pyrinomonadaceae bacterium]
MFTTRSHSQAKSPEGKPKQEPPKREAKESPKQNPLWQSLAMPSTVIQRKLAGGQASAPSDGEANQSTPSSAQFVLHTSTANSGSSVPYPRSAEQDAAILRKPANGSGLDNVSAGRADASIARATGRLWRALALRRTPRTRGEDDLAQASAGAMAESRGEALPDAQARRFEASLGASFADVRVHTDAAAERAAHLVDARAVTTGHDIYFARGQYAPGTLSGDQLLAHELTHVTQERNCASTGELRVSQPSDDTERAAVRAESIPTPSVAPTQAASAAAPPLIAPSVSPAAPGGRILHRQIEELEAIILYEAYRSIRAYRAREDVVELQGHPTFDPNDDLAEWIGTDTSAVNVNIRFGNLASGSIPIYVDEHELYQSDGVAIMPLYLSGLGDEDPSVRPLLMLSVHDSRVIGAFGGVTSEIADSDPLAVLHSLLNGGARRLLEWRGIEHVEMSDTPGHLTGGHLTLSPRPFSFDLSGIFTGSGNFGIQDGTVTFDATASLHVGGLEDATLSLTRDRTGSLSGTARMAVRLGGFDGSLLASFGRGVLDIRGTANYSREGFEGSVTLLVTDETSAWAAVNGQLTAWGPAAVGSPTPALGPVQGAATGGGAQPAATDSAAARHVIAGWGTVEFRYKDWLHGRAQVIVDPNGDITSLGRVHVPRDIPFMDEKSFAPRRIAGISGNVHVASVWDILAIRMYASGSIHGAASIGPGYLRNLHASGAFSTRQGFQNHLTIGGALEMRAGAALRIVLTGGIGAYVQVPIVGEVTEHARLRVMSTDLTLTGTGEIEAYARGDAAIHRTSTRGSGEADYSISGVLSAGGSIGFTFGGEVWVRIPLHSRRLLTFQNRRYRLGHVHGSVQFRNFKIGSSEPPELVPRNDGGRVPVNDLFHAIISDGEGIPTQSEPEDETTSWTPSGPGDVVEPDAAEPTQPNIPGDPHSGLPTIPPIAAPPAQQGPPPPGGTVDQQAGAADASSQGSDMDAGLPPDADVDTGDAGGSRDADVPIAGGITPPEPQPEPEPETQIPNRDRNLDVPFDMEGTPHHLILTPGPVLLMSSDPARLILKLRQKRAEVDGLARDPANGAGYDNQRNVLDELIREAQAVEAEAARLGFDEGRTGSVPGLRPLADRIHMVAQQFDWHDIVAYLSGDPDLAPESAADLPFIEFTTRFGRPADLFRRAFANLGRSGLSEDDLRGVLRAFTSTSDTRTLGTLLDNLASGGADAQDAASFLGRVSRIREVPGVTFDLTELHDAHLRGDAILDHGPIQSGMLLEDMVRGARATLAEGRLDVGTGGRMPASLRTPPSLDFVIIERRGTFRLVLGREHSGLSNGRAYVYGAGEIRFDRDGIVTQMTRRSGHYQPSFENLRRSYRLMMDRGILSPMRSVDILDEY